MKTNPNLNKPFTADERKGPITVQASVFEAMIRHELGHLGPIGLMLAGNDRNMFQLMSRAFAATLLVLYKAGLPTTLDFEPNGRGAMAVQTQPGDPDLPMYQTPADATEELIHGDLSEMIRQAREMYEKQQSPADVVDAFLSGLVKDDADPDADAEAFDDFDDE